MIERVPPEWAILGDGLLGVFGAPDPADRAVAAAAAMLDAVEQAFDGPVRIGIGINAGLVLAGTIGGGDLLELGVIGDSVNVAARVQDATREPGEPLLLTEATRLLLEDGGDGLAARGSLTLRGEPEPIGVHGFELRNASRTAPA